MRRPSGPRVNEPLNWWTEAERQQCAETLIVEGPFRDWRGREYRRFTSPAHGNIYRERFSWKEYTPPPIFGAPQSPNLPRPK